MDAPRPNPFAWKSKLNDRYLRLDGTIKTQAGILEFTEEDPNYDFKTEDHSGCVNIKDPANKKYLKGVPAPNGGNSTLWIVATADTPNNDKGDANCTLFELDKSVSTNDFRACHVHSGLYLKHQVIDGHNAVLTADGPKGDYIFTATARP